MKDNKPIINKIFISLFFALKYNFASIESEIIFSNNYYIKVTLVFFMINRYSTGF